MKNDFLRFIAALFLFASLLFLCDRSVAMVEDKLYFSQDTKINYSLRDDVADIVILGSSRASHHYIPQILIDSLNMTCVNLGEDGQGILYGASLANTILENTPPKVIIYEFGGFDWKDGIGNNIESLGVVYDKNACFREIASIKLPSWVIATTVFKSYRYNSQLHKTLLNTYETNSPLYGYEPMYGEKKDGYEIKLLDKEEVTIDNYKLSVLKTFIDQCQDNDVCLVFVTSPRYGISGELDKQLPLKMFSELGVPYWDYSNSTLDTSLFIDNGHMNNKGAEWFTSQIASDLKQYLKECEF